MPELGRPPDIYAFAQNGMTSAEMLQRTYLRFIEEEATAKRARAQIRPGDWSMVKRIDKNGQQQDVAALKTIGIQPQQS